MNGKIMTEKMGYFFITLVFMLFIVTLHPTITVGDSSELVAAVFNSGVPHPPGYPLFINIARMITLILPFGNIAFRVNILSAIFGAFSCYLVYLITLRIYLALETGYHGLQFEARNHKSEAYSSLPALFAGASLALSFEFWYRSTVAEVYSLNTFLILLIIYTMLLWKESLGKKSSLLYLVSFILGLGIGNHHTMVLIIPGIAVYVIWNGSKSEVGNRKSEAMPLVRYVFLASLFFLIGLSVYLYLPLRSAKNPFMDWGNPQNLRNFIDVFTRKTYLPEEIGRDWGMFIKQLKTFNPIYEFTPIGFVFGLIGLWGMWKRDKATAVMLSSLFLLTSYGLILLAGSSSGEANILKKFYVPSHALFSIFIGVGIITALKYSTEETLYPFYITLALTMVSLLLQLSIHYPKNWNTDNYIVHDYGMNEFNSLGEGSVYISKGEVKTFPLWYLQGVERYREDVKIITAYFLSQRWYGEEALRLVATSLHVGGSHSYKQMMVDAIYRGNEGKGVYTGFIDGEYITDDLNTYSQGITFLLYRDSKPALDLDVWNMYQMRGVKKIDKGMDAGTVEIVRDYASGHYNTGLEYYEKGEKERAVNEFKATLSLNPDDPDALNNLAVLYADKGIKLEEAKMMADKAFEIYTGEKDRSMVLETLEEIKRKEGEMEAL